MNETFRRPMPKGIAALILLAGMLPAGAAADDKPSAILIGGSQAGSRDSYSYLGFVMPALDGQVGQGWYVRAVASWISYRYDKDVDGRTVEVRAKAPGVDAGLGYAWRSAASSADLSLAVGARHTSLSPDVQTDGPKGSNFTLTPQVMAQHSFGPSVDADLLANYSFGTQDRFARARLGLHPNSRWRTGVEAAVAAGADYRNTRAGLFAGTSFASGWWVDLSAGRSHSRDGKQGNYLSVALSKSL